MSPSDIDVIAAGHEARVRLSAYRQRNLAPIRGEVLSVSADRIVDERTGANYYSAEIAIDEIALADAQAHSRENIILATDMPVEVMIVTGQRTMLEYLLDPLFASLRRGLRES